MTGKQYAGYALMPPWEIEYRFSTIEWLSLGFINRFFAGHVLL